MIDCIQGLEDSILLICQLFPKWSIDSAQSQTTFYQAFLVDTQKLSLTWLGKAKELE